MRELQLRDLVARYLAHELAHDHFAEQFTLLYFEVRNDRDESDEARKLCNTIVLPFAELSRGHRSEQSFREELANAFIPSASRDLGHRSYQV